MVARAAGAGATVPGDRAALSGRRGNWRHPVAVPTFAPDPARLYEVLADGKPFTEYRPAGDDAARRLLLRRWWLSAVLLNLAAASVAALGAMLLPHLAAAWLGLLPLAAAPLLAVAPLLARRDRPRRRVHRARPRDFPPLVG